MILIDTHTHLYSEEFESDRTQMMDRALAAGVEHFFVPAIDSSYFNGMQQIQQQYPQNVHLMMGLHPCYIKSDHEKILKKIEKELFAAPEKFTGVGEIGLDFYWDNTYRNQQYEVFHQQIRIAIQKNLPIVIHSRNAIDECIEVVRQYKEAKGVFHCFSGSLQQAQKIIDLGFMMGIGGVVTFKNAGLDVVIKELGVNNVILETDAPYLAPAPFRGKRNEPSYLKFIVEKISAIIGKSNEEIDEVFFTHD